MWKSFNELIIILPGNAVTVVLTAFNNPPLAKSIDLNTTVLLTSCGPAPNVGAVEQDEKLCTNAK